jgi:hypothetical protein
MIINLIDEAFRHLPISVHGKTSELIQYQRDMAIWDGVTIFTDSYICSPVVAQVKSKYKLGWILESRPLIPHIYEALPNFIDQYDFVMTHDEDLLKQFPEKTRKVIFGGCWIDESNYAIHPKTKSLSMIYSAKTMLDGHRLRHDVANAGFRGLDLFGAGAGNPIDKKEEALVDYRFSIVIENTKRKNYFTEKLVDCFATGTIPVYYGCENISDYFDESGIIKFESKEELENLLPTLTDELYEEKLEAVKSNFSKFKNYAVTEDWLYYNTLQEFK